MYERGQRDIPVNINERKGSVLLIDVCLAAYEPTDATGLPEIVNGETRYAWPTMLPTHAECEGFDYVLVFFDEVNQNELLFAPLYRIVNDRQINGHWLADNVRIVAAGNRSEGQ